MALCGKSIRIINKKAIQLIEARARRESRSAANAAAQTIIETLGKNVNPCLDNTVEGQGSQQENSAKL